MTRTKLIAAALAAVCGVAVCAGPQAGTPLRTDAGTARYDIAVAADASAVERTAAQELQSYLKKITGADFPVVTAGAAGAKPIIAVGPGAALAVAPKLDLSKTELGDDGIVLKTVGENRQFGWNRFNPNLRGANGCTSWRVSHAIRALRVYGRALRVSEAIAAHRDEQYIY